MSYVGYTSHYLHPRIAEHKHSSCSIFQHCTNAGHNFHEFNDSMIAKCRTRFDWRIRRRAWNLFQQVESQLMWQAHVLSALPVETLMLWLPSIADCLSRSSFRVPAWGCYVKLLLLALRTSDTFDFCLSMAPALNRNLWVPHFNFLSELSPNTLNSTFALSRKKRIYLNKNLF